LPKIKQLSFPKKFKLSNGSANNIGLTGEYDFSEAKRRQEERGLQLLIGGATDVQTKELAKSAMERDEMEESYASSLDTDSYDSSIIEMDDDSHKDQIALLNEPDILDLPSTIVKTKKSKGDKDTDDSKGDETDGDTDIEETSAELADLDDDEYDFVEEEEVEEKGTFQKIKRIEVDESEKIYKESIQKGDLFKYKLEKFRD